MSVVQRKQRGNASEGNNHSLETTDKEQKIKMNFNKGTKRLNVNIDKKCSIMP